MKKILITFALLLSFISVAVADVTFQPYNIEIQNNGSKNLYVALARTTNHYNDNLGISVNGKTVKQEVWQFIAPNKIIYLKLQPLKDFNNFTNSFDMDYIFSFGLTLQAAQYYLDQVAIFVQYNSEPLQYTLSHDQYVISKFIINSNTTLYYVDSNSSVFKY